MMRNTIDIRIFTLPIIDAGCAVVLLQALQTDISHACFRKSESLFQRIKTLAESILWYIVNIIGLLSNAWF